MKIYRNAIKTDSHRLSCVLMIASRVRIHYCRSRTRVQMHSCTLQIVAVVCMNWCFLLELLANKSKMNAMPESHCAPLVFISCLCVRVIKSSHHLPCNIWAIRFIWVIGVMLMLFDVYNVNSIVNSVECIPFSM